MTSCVLWSRAELIYDRLGLASSECVRNYFIVFLALIAYGNGAPRLRSID